MGLNLFIAVACVVAAILITILALRFFFADADGESTDSDADAPAFVDQPADAHAHAGDTLRTRRSDNAASVSLLRRQTLVGAALTLLVLVPFLVHAANPAWTPAWLVDPWTQAILITPVMFFSGYPIHIDGWDALRRRDPNMNSLASIGATAAYAYSLLLCVAGGLFPEGMREAYFEVTGVIITLVLMARLGVNRWLPRRPAFPLQTKVDRVSRVWVPVVILIALWTFVGWLVFGTQPSCARALLIGISVLIIACPVALGWAAPLAASAALDDARRHGMAVRTTAALQQAQHIRALVVSSSLEPDARAALDGLEADGVAVTTVDAHDTAEAVEAIRARRAAHRGATLAFLGDGSEDVAVRNEADIAIVCSPIDFAADDGPKHADVVADGRDGMCVPRLIRLSKAMVRNIQENLIWAFVFNLIGVPIAAGVLFPFTGWMLNPMLACLAMILSSACVVLNAWRLRRFDPRV